MSNGHRLIEEVLPIASISREAAREKSIRHGHISTLHIWWARRPLVACRAAILGALLEDPGPGATRRELEQFLQRFCTWEASNDPSMLETARKLILRNNGGNRPKVLDCFAGGGAIPLEALRSGCEAYALELNPVAVLIELCTLLYPQKFGMPMEVESKQSNLQQETKHTVSNKLVADVERWGNWIFETTKAELRSFYPAAYPGEETIAYLWMRTVKCQNPKCRAEIPLFHHLWLARSKLRRIALQPLVDHSRKAVEFRVVEGPEIDFDPSQTTVKRATVNCLVCNSSMAADQTKAEAKAGNMGQRLVAVAFHRKKERKKLYRIATVSDLAAFENAKETLAELRRSKSSIPLVPNEKMPPIGTYGIDAQRYTVNETWGELFNSRQLLALTTLCSKVKRVHESILEETNNAEYARVIATYLALAIDRCANQNSGQSVWVVDGEKVAGAFGQQTVQTVWDYVEPNPIGDNSWAWPAHVNWVVNVIKHCSDMGADPGDVRQGTATSLPYPDDYFDAVVTDPPYYHYVPYSDLSDFFYVWLKRSIGELYPQLFGTPLAPKSPEIIQNTAFKLDGGVKDKEFFELEMAKSFGEVYRVLKPDGICVVVFAHKTTTAWETLITALLKAGFMVSASWPLHTERPGRLRAQESAALASSVWLTCRKRSKNAPAGQWKNVQDELEMRVRERMDFFLAQGIRGADALLSAIGPALEVFGRYSYVEKMTGEAVTVADFLDKVREVVSHQALSSVLEEQEMGAIDPETAFYVLWKWSFEGREASAPHDAGEPKRRQAEEGPVREEEGEEEPAGGGKAKVPVDDALKLSRSVGAEFDSMIRSDGTLRKDGEYVRLMGPEDRRRVKGLGEKGNDGRPPTIIDMLQRAANLWAAGDRAALEEFLEISGAKTSEAFWKVAGALSRILPLDSKEKQLLDGLWSKHGGGVSQSAPGGKYQTDLGRFLQGGP